MQISAKESILNAIKEHDSIIIARHIRPDGDAIGSSMGLRRILSLSFPDKDIRLCNKDGSDYMAFLGEEDFSVDEGFIKDSLAIVLDTATRERVSDPRVFSAESVIKIDHHIEIDHYGDISWVEEHRSSTSEMIADFYRTFSDELRIDSYAAACLYTGIITDSGSFRYSSTTGETMRLAALMLDQGIDIESINSNLNIKDIRVYRFQADVFSKVKITENGLASIFIDQEMQRKWNLSREDASESISLISMIKGSIAWIAFIENADGTIRCRLRSRFMTISEVAERYHGGGHAKAAGATCYTHEEMESLIRDADRAVKEYKESHSGWL